MRKAIDLLGMKFNKWTVVERAESKSDGSLRWLCRCECGKESIVTANNLRRGGSKQCKDCSSLSLSKPIDPKAKRVYKPSTPQKEMYNKNQNKRRLWTLYRITPEDWKHVSDYQGGVCAISGNSPGKYNLSIDHDHSSGRFRGLLSPMFNRGLAMFNDDPVLLRKAADYLENPTAPRALGKEIYGLIGKARGKKKMIYGGPNGERFDKEGNSLKKIVYGKENCE